MWHTRFYVEELRNNAHTKKVSANFLKNVSSSPGPRNGPGSKREQGGSAEKVNN